MLPTIDCRTCTWPPPLASSSGIQAVLQAPSEWRSLLLLGELDNNDPNHAQLRPSLNC